MIQQYGYTYELRRLNQKKEHLEKILDALMKSALGEELTPYEESLIKRRKNNMFTRGIIKAEIQELKGKINMYTMLTKKNINV